MEWHTCQISSMSRRFCLLAFPRAQRYRVVCIWHLAVIWAGTIALGTPSVFGQLFSSANQQWQTEIDRSTLEELIRTILLDEPRRLQAQRLYDAHVKRFAAFAEQRRAHIREIDEGLRGIPFDDIEYNLGRNRRAIATAEAALACIELDRQLFEEWKLLLLDVELEHEWPRFERRWRREAWLRSRALFNEERVDLVQVVESLDLDWEAFLHKDGVNTLTATLDEYGDRLDLHLGRLNTVLIDGARQRAQEDYEFTQLLRDSSRLIEQSIEQGHPLHKTHITELRQMVERQQDISEAIKRRQHEELRVRNRIRTLNRSFRRWMLGMMPTEQIQAFEEAWYRQASPTLFTGWMGRTDRYAMEILAIDELTDEQTDRVDHCQRRHRWQIAPLNRAIIEHEDELTEHRLRHAAGITHNRDREIELERRVNQAYADRYNAGNQAIQCLTAILSDEQRKLVSAPREIDYLAFIESERKRLEDDPE